MKEGVIVAQQKGLRNLKAQGIREFFLQRSTLNFGNQSCRMGLPSSYFSLMLSWANLVQFPRDSGMDPVRNST